MPRGTATLDQVVESSAGVAGWAASDQQDNKCQASGAQVAEGKVEKIDSSAEEVPITLSPGSPVPSTSEVTNEVPNTDIVREFFPSVSGYQEKGIFAGSIPIILGKGGFHIKNIIKFGTKKWYEANPESDKKCPRIRIQLDSDFMTSDIESEIDSEKDEKGPSFIKVRFSSTDKTLIDICVSLLNDHLKKLAHSIKLGLTPNDGRPTGFGEYQQSHSSSKAGYKNGPKNTYQKNNRENGQQMIQAFRVEMETRMIGKIIGKKGINCEKMVKFVCEQDPDKMNAKKTKIFVKEQVKPFKKGMCIDLKDQSDGSDEYIVFMTSVYTHNPYFTMRNVERAITHRLDNLHGSYSFEKDLSQKLEENEEKEESLSKQMFDEALEEEFGSVENNPSSW